ncbi:MAG: hypothetical protein JNK77_08500 [Saprospiraceae bacterium]|nr:hypothetical protein [Saprospiraceae bacterium]
MKTICLPFFLGCAGFLACTPIAFEPCQSLYLSIAYDLDGWCAYDNPGFEFNYNTWCQSDNEVLEVLFDPPYSEAPAPMILRSKLMSFGCDLAIDYLGNLPGAPPMSYTYQISAQGEWSVITIAFSSAVYTYLTTPSYPHVDKKLACTLGVRGLGQGSP